MKTKLREIGISPDEANPLLVEKDSAPITQQVKASSLITRPHITLTDLVSVSAQTATAVAEVLNEEPLAVEQTEILLKYEGYIERRRASPKTPAFGKPTTSKYARLFSNKKFEYRSKGKTFENPTGNNWSGGACFRGLS